MDQTYGKMEQGDSEFIWEEQIIMELEHWFKILIQDLPYWIKEMPDGVP